MSLSWIKYGRVCKRCNEERTCRHWKDVLCTTCTAVEEIKASMEAQMKHVLGVQELPESFKDVVAAVAQIEQETQEAIKRLLDEIPT